MSGGTSEGWKERLKLFWPPLSWIFQATDVLALVMPSCKSGATSPSSVNTVKTKNFFLSLFDFPPCSPWVTFLGGLCWVCSCNPPSRIPLPLCEVCLQTLAHTIHLVHIYDDMIHRSEGFPRTRIRKSSCACDCGRGPLTVGAFFFFFFLLSSSHPEIFAGKKAMFRERGGRRRSPGEGKK